MFQWPKRGDGSQTAGEPFRDIGEGGVQRRNGRLQFGAADTNLEILRIGDVGQIQRVLHNNTSIAVHLTYLRAV